MKSLEHGKKFAKILDCSVGALWYYRNGSAIPQQVFSKIITLLPFQINYKEFQDNWRQTLGAMVKNKLYTSNLKVEERAKGLHNRKLTEKERLILHQNEKLKIPYKIKTHFSIIKENEYANFDIAYFQNDEMILVEDVEGNFNRNMKLNWFKVWRFIEKKKFVSVPMIVTWFPCYGFNPLMRLVLIKSEILPVSVGKKMERLTSCFKNFKKLLIDEKKANVKELNNLLKFNKAGTKSEIEKPYTDEEEAIHEMLTSRFNCKGKSVIKDSYGFLHVVDDVVTIDGKVYLVEFFNRSSVVDIFRRRIGFCFMVDMLFKKGMGRL